MSAYRHGKGEGFYSLKSGWGSGGRQLVGKTLHVWPHTKLEATLREVSQGQQKHRN